MGVDGEEVDVKMGRSDSSSSFPFLFLSSWSPTYSLSPMEGTSSSSRAWIRSNKQT